MSATSVIAIRDDQNVFTDLQVKALAQLGVEKASKADLAVFFHQCVRTGLDPFLRQIYLIERQGKQTIQTGIDGFRLIARRAVDRQREKLSYDREEWCGADGVWRDVWLEDEPPRAARITVYRNGEPFPGMALMSEYRATKRDGTVTKMWREKPVLMLAKCAEALALRRAFPQELSGLYTTDEMGSDEPGTVIGQGEPSAAGETRRMSRANREAKPGTADAVEAEIISDEPETSDPDEQAMAELNAEAAEQAAEAISEPESTGLFQ